MRQDPFAGFMKQDIVLNSLMIQREQFYSEVPLRTQTLDTHG